MAKPANKKSETEKTAKADNQEPEQAKLSDSKELANQDTLRQKGIFLLPNLFTTTALFFGFYAILAAFNEHYVASAIGIFVAMVFDFLDGRVARLTGTQSAFGAEYDSLSDVIAFGLAPALVAYLWALNYVGKLGWAAAFIYVAGTALRLARFNTQIGTVDKKYFIGLASPAAAAIVASAVWFMTEAEIAGQTLSVPFTLLVGLVGVLMVSNFKYYSFKDISNRHRVPFMAMIALVLIFALVAIDPSTFFLFSSLGYAASGPVYTAWLKLKRK